MTGVVDNFDYDRASGLDVEPLSSSGPGRPTLDVIVAIVAALAGLIAGSNTVFDDERLFVRASLPTLYWIAVALAVAVSASILWRRSGQGRYILVVLVPLWVLLLHTAPLLGLSGYLPGGSLAAIERATAITSEGLIAGQVSDASGFHGLLSTVTADAPSSLVEWAARLWPSFVTLVSAVLVSGLASRSYPRTPAVGPVAALVYVLVAWFDVGFLGSGAVGLVVLLAILVLTESGPLQSDTGSGTSLAVVSRQAESLGDRPESYSVQVFVALLLLSFGAVVGDVATPAAICGAFAVLAFFGRRAALRLWLLSLVVYTAWSVLVGRPWWSSGLTEVADLPARLVDLLLGGSSIPLGQRVAGWGGVVMMLFVLAVGLLMTRGRFSQLRPTVPLVPLALVSAFAVAVSSSTETMASSAVSVLAPFAAVLAGRLLSGSSRSAATVMTSVLLAVSIPVFLLIRFGDMPADADLAPVPVGDLASLSATDASNEAP